MLIVGEDLDHYHSHPACSHSKLRDFDSLGPKGYYLRHVKREQPRPDTKALRAGRAFETYLTEPETFKAWFVVKPEDYNGRTNKWKDWATEQELSGKTILDRDDFLAFEHMAKAVRECSSAMALLEAGVAQPTFRIDWGGLPGVQSRPDFANIEGCPRSDFRPYTLDLKTTKQLSDITTGRAIVKFGHHTQAAMARIACQEPECVSYLLAVEKAFPCRAVIVEIERTFVNIGEDWALSTLARLAEHYETDHWPLTVDDSVVVSAPRWLLAEYDAQFSDDPGDVEEGEAVAEAAESP